MSPAAVKSINRSGHFKLPAAVNNFGLKKIKIQI
jgi:hypothetical protein